MAAGIDRPSELVMRDRCAGGCSRSRPGLIHSGRSAKGWRCCWHGPRRETAGPCRWISSKLVTLPSPVTILRERSATPQRRLGRLAPRTPRCRSPAGRGKQPQGGGGDDPERALGPDQQVASGHSRYCPCEAASARSRFPPSGMHRLQPQTQVARIAIAQHVDPAGVGRQIAADPRRALARPATAETADPCRARRAPAPRQVIMRRPRPSCTFSPG